MKILLIDVNYGTSSTGKLALDLYEMLRAEGHEAAICYGRGKRVTGVPGVFKFGLDWETCLHALLTRLTGYTARFSRLSTRRLIRYIRAFEPDVVHLHELHAYFVDLEALLGFLAESGIRTVFTLHCEFDYTGKCGYAFECEKWKTRCGGCPRLRAYPKALFFDRTREMHEQKKRLFGGLKDPIVTSPSAWLTGRAKASFLGKYRIETVYNGVNRSVFYPRDTGALRQKLGIGEGPVAVSVGQHIMSGIKGGRRVLRLAEEMKDITFVLVGCDTGRIVRKENVVFVPFVTDRETLTQYYSLGDVFLLSSERETFSMCCAEALSCGVPVAGYRCGAPELLFEEPYACFVPFGDEAALREAIRRQIRRGKTLDAARYAERFSRERMLARYIELYREAAETDKTPDRMETL